MSESSKQCIANITYGTHCDQLVDIYRGEGTDNSVMTSPLDFINGVSEYCLLVTAVNGNVTVIVEGTITLADCYIGNDVNNC